MALVANHVAVHLSGRIGERFGGASIRADASQRWRFGEAVSFRLIIRMLLISVRHFLSLSVDATKTRHNCFAMDGES